MLNKCSDISLFTSCDRHSHEDSKKDCNVGKLLKEFFSTRIAQIPNFFIVASILSST